MELFKEWKGKIKETFKDVVGELDPAEKRLSDLVERATHEALPAPDLALNLAIADEVNANPGIAIDVVTRAIRRAFLKNIPHVQLLALALLEMVVKNSLPAFFQHLATSELFAEMLRVGDPMRRWDPDVRDRTLCLVEDFGRGLPLPAFKTAYEGLVDRGVDFPVRQLPDSDTTAPYYSPPQLPPPPPPAYGAPPVMGGAAGPVPPRGPLIGPDVSAEDAAAIRAAMAEFDAEYATHTGGAAAAGAADGHPVAGAPVPGIPGLPAVAAAAPGQHGAGHAPGIPVVPRSPRSIEQAVRVASNSAELLTEMMAPIRAAAAGSGDVSGVGEPFVADLADQCYRHRSVLSEIIPGCEDETLLSAALVANDDLSRALTVYEELAATHASRSGGGGTATAGRQPQGSSGGGSGLAAAPAAAAAVASGAAAAASAAAAPLSAHFSLLDEGEDEEAAQLQTNRSSRPGTGIGGVPATTHGSASPLIDLGDIDLGAGPSTAAAPAQASTDALEQGMSKLGVQGPKP